MYKLYLAFSFLPHFLSILNRKVFLLFLFRAIRFQFYPSIDFSVLSIVKTLWKPVSFTETVNPNAMFDNSTCIFTFLLQNLLLHYLPLLPPTRQSFPAEASISAKPLQRSRALLNAQGLPAQNFFNSRGAYN